MALRCLLFSSDGGVADLICRVLADLGVDAEYCAEALTAVEKVTHHPFQIVIIDWDNQPEAGLLLKTARERKANERPLTLAIVCDDASVPKALQAGANSILRKPILINQVKDTLTTARDLLRARQESAVTTAQAAAAGVAASPGARPVSMVQGTEKTLRAGEFLQSSVPAPGGQFETESNAAISMQPTSEAVDPLKDLEPVAASVATPDPVAPPLPPPSSEPRGLEWYLKQRAGTLPPIPARATPAPAPDKPELLGYDQTPSQIQASPAPVDKPSHPPREQAAEKPSDSELKAEAELFAYVAGEREEPHQARRTSFALGKRTILFALLLAGAAVMAAPQAPWHPAVRAVWARGRQALHAWLNPQPVITPQAPDSHENFARAGDEYKMPVAENIPDATTDPSQIRVVPVVDPTAKKPNAGANADQTAGQDGTVSGDSSQAPAGTTPSVPAPGAPTSNVPTSNVPPSGPQVSQSPALAAPAPAQPANVPGATASTAGSPAGAPVTVQQTHNSAPMPVTASAPPTPQPALARNPQPHYAATPANVPSSLKSQIASMTPDASGNKPVEAALPSIEPVAVSEAAERALLTDQPPIAYPATARGQQGTVILQVLIGPDGTVQDAKFVQGSLAFARSAIDGVKRWKFKPYLMNARAASVQTQLTLSFKPGS